MIEKKRKSTGFNIVTSIITKIILLLGGFFTSILIARLLGPEGKGIVTAIFVIPTLIVSLADLGVRQATAYSIGRKKYKLEDIVASTGFLWLITSCISVIAVYLIFMTGQSEQYGWLLLGLALITIPINLVSEYSKGVLQGVDKIGTINILQIVTLCVNILGVIILVWVFKLGVLGAVLVTVLASLITAGFYLYNLGIKTKVRIKYIKPIPFELFSNGIKFALALFVLNLNYRIDIVLLEKFLTKTEVGLYSVGVNIAELVWQIPAAIGFVLFSKSANSKSDNEAVNRSIRLLRISLPLMLFICLFIAIISPYFISFVYGENFALSANVTRLLMPGVLLMMIVKILHPDLAARGFPLFAFWVYLIPVILNVTLNFYMIPHYGIDGAALTSTISYVVGGSLFAVVYSKKERIPLKNILIINKEDMKMIRKKLFKLLKIEV